MKNKMKTVIIAILATIMLSACGTTHSLSLGTKPYMLDTNPPAGPENYQTGWKDGCESGMAANNTNFNMTMGSQVFKINSNLQSDRLYNVAWQYAYNHCGYSMKALSSYSL